MFQKKKMLVPKKPYLFRLYSSTLAKKVILKLRLFSKKNIEKNVMMYIETNFQFPKSFKKIKKQKKNNRLIFFFLLQNFCKNLCDDNMIIISQLFRLFLLGCVTRSDIFLSYWAYFLTDISQLFLEHFSKKIL